MPALTLNHYTIKVRDLEGTKEFYKDIVGLAVGERPPLPFPGYWLYCGEIPTVHLIGYRADDPQIPDGRSYPAPTGPLDHIAFNLQYLKEMRENLKSPGYKYRRTRAAAVST